MKFSRHKKKWGLFFVLAISTGFNLSMNPEHFNNIARYPIHSLDLATQADPNQESKVTGAARETLVSGSRGSFKAKVYSVDDSTFVRFENLDRKVEASTCELCGKSFVLNSNFKNIEDVQKELVALANGDEAKADGQKPVVQKKGEATEVDIEAWAAKCDKVSESSKLNCHKGRLLELSKFLKNSTDNSGLVAEYFNEYLKQDLMTAFTAPTVKSGFLGSSFEADSSMLEEANDMSEQIISGLMPKNGKKTIELLTKMRAASFTAQLRNAQQLMIQGKTENNMYKWQLGFMSMQPENQRLLLGSAAQSMLGAVDSMQATATEKSYYSQFIANNMYQPVDSILNQLKNAQASGTSSSGQGSSTGQSSLSALESFLIPSLGESTAVINPQILNTDINTLIASRRGDQSRGSDISVMWGTGDANRFSLQAPASRGVDRLSVRE